MGSTSTTKTSTTTSSTSTSSTVTTTTTTSSTISTTIASKCNRPAQWCTHRTSYFSEVDCDEDGILDPYCQDAFGGVGYISSSTGCTDTWPSGVCHAETVTTMATTVATTVTTTRAASISTTIASKCYRPAQWCTHRTSYFSEVDCDEDGILDPHCQDAFGDVGYISSSTGCTDTWPSGVCHAETVFTIAGASEGGAVANGDWIKIGS